LYLSTDNFRMGLDFERIKHKVEHGTGHQWTSYSDLFLVLSVTFLLLYVVANLRGGAAAVVAQEQLRVSSARMSELEKQVKAYEVLKDDYIDKGASKDEVAMYRDLEDKLALLENQAQDEYEDAQAKAREAKLKFNGLNKYQALIKNIVNANLVGSAKSKRQLTMLDDRDGRIEEKDVKIDNLDAETKAQEKTIESNKRRIAKIKEDLQHKEQSLKNVKNMSTKQRRELEAKLRAEREEAGGKIAQLESQNRDASQQLEKTQVELDRKSRLASRLSTDLKKSKEDFESQMQSARAEHEAQVAKDREKYEQQIGAARATAAQKAQAARELKAKMAASEAEMNQKIAQLESEQKQTAGKLGQAEAQLAAKSREAERLMGDLQKSQGEYERKLGEAKAEHAAAVARERGKLEGQLKAAKMSAAEKAAAEAGMRARLAQAEKEMNDKIATLAGNLEGTKRKLASAERQYGESIGALQRTNQTLQRDLNTSVTKLGAQRRLAAQLKANLRAVGIDAEVDPKTGDLTISFGDEYFDTGSATLKPGMVAVVRKMMPVYAKSLFENAEIARKLDTVEIVGFASPTFQGRVVDPQSMAAADRAAVNYNMDLSYKRAKSIFDFAFDQKKIAFEKQKNLLPLVKVSGRSYLTADRAPASKGGNDSDYCANNNCQKHQIVVIRFTLKE
jgi:chromosome segregation ATPase